MVGNIIHRKRDNTIIKKTNNTQKNRQYSYKKRQTMVGNNNTQKNRQYNYKKDKKWLAT